MKRVLHYVFYTDNQHKDHDYVVTTYTDGSTRTVYRGEHGFNSARSKACSNRRSK
jgi:hypothetical protein